MTVASSRTITPRTLTRAEAARLVRAARSAFHDGSERAGELIGWALSALRESIPVRKLKIDYLLSVGHFDSADAMIARTIMQGHDDAQLRLRFAQSLYAQRRLEQADIEIRSVLAIKPGSINAMALAARIAGDRGDHARAVTMLTLANEARVGDAAIEQELVQALLDAGLVNHAAEQLERMKSPPAILTARVLWAQRRLLEAMDGLEWSVSRIVPGDSIPPDLVDDLLQLVEYLDQTLDAPRLRRLIPVLTNAPLNVRQRAARILFMVGEANTIIEWFQPTEGSPALPLSADAMRMVADTLHSWTSNDTIYSSGVGTESLLCVKGDDTRSVASLWLRGLMGVNCTSQCNGRQAGADPSRAVLPSLLREAVGAITGRLDSARLPAGTRATLEHHRATCLKMLGWSDHATGSAVEPSQDEPAALRRAA